MIIMPANKPSKPKKVPTTAALGSSGKIKNQDNSSFPVLITRNTVLFPHYDENIDVGRLKSINAINLSSEQYESKIIVLCQKAKDNDDPDPTEENLYMFGTLAKITDVESQQDGALKVNLVAVERIQVNEIIKTNDLYFGYGNLCATQVGDHSTERALVNEVMSSTNRYFAAATRNKLAVPTLLPKRVLDRLTDADKSAEELCDALSHYLTVFSPADKQVLLSEVNLNKRLELLNQKINEQIKVLELESNISKNIKQKMESWQKEYFLREKMKAIKEELGETYDRDSDIENIKKRVEANPYPEAIKSKILEEISRYEAMPQASTESNIIRTYIEWLVELPWYQTSSENLNLTQARKHLDANHYGIEKPKDRIIEYLAVKMKTSSLKGPIICFVGPPGVGKTSLARSIASAINRNFVKASLGGVREEAEIRGHRRTYIGALPGRIIQGMRKAKTKNPLFLLDEIDKMSSDFRGDPASALLEVLDPEQNKYFSDHYIGEEFDLTDVMFITTANYYENIPYPLLDRMEIITLNSYTELEKLVIAQKYLMPKVLKDHGLNAREIKINKTIMLSLIRHYTKEAGVRQLERVLAKLARKTVMKIMSKKAKNVVVTKEIVLEFLGKPLYNYTKKTQKSEVGVVTGLAYTAYGGDILPIEVTHFAGRGKLLLTGQLGDVMKESANIALGYIKAHANEFKIDEDYFENRDIHIHVPEGAVPKDGPSAGVTLTTAIISALTKKAVDCDIAMTGEITLRGHVLPIGGLKEKLISADRSLLKTVFIPFENKKDLDDVPKEVQNNLQINFAKTYKDIYQHIFKSTSKITK